MKKLFSLFLMLWIFGMVGVVYAQNERPPEVLNRYSVMDKIGYPDAAKAEGITGKVLAEVTVSPKGKVEAYSIQESPSPILSAAVKKHIHNLKFRPAAHEGTPIRSKVLVPFRFELPEEGALEGPLNRLAPRRQAVD